MAAIFTSHRLCLKIWVTSFTSPELKQSLQETHKHPQYPDHPRSYYIYHGLATLSHYPNMTHSDEIWWNIPYNRRTQILLAPWSGHLSLGSDRWLEVWFGPSKSHGNSKFNGDGRSLLAMKISGDKTLELSYSFWIQDDFLFGILESSMLFPYTVVKMNNE